MILYYYHILVYEWYYTSLQAPLQQSSRSKAPWQKTAFKKFCGEKNSVDLHADKSFFNLVESNQNQIVFIIFWLIATHSILINSEQNRIPFGSTSIGK